MRCCFWAAGGQIRSHDACSLSAASPCLTGGPFRRKPEPSASACVGEQEDGDEAGRADIGQSLLTASSLTPPPVAHAQNAANYRTEECTFLQYDLRLALVGNPDGVPHIDLQDEALLALQRQFHSSQLRRGWQVACQLGHRVINLGLFAGRADVGPTTFWVWGFGVRLVVS